MELSAEYLKAISASNVAAEIYNTSRKAYRDRAIGDAEFEKAIFAHKEAVNAFDIAFAKEQGAK